MRLVLVPILALLSGPTGDAAEIALRPSVEVSGSVIRLSDLADLRGADAERLGASPIGPAPAPGVRAFVSAETVRDMLGALGEDPSQHIFRGAYRVDVARVTDRFAAEPIGITSARRPSSATAFRVTPGANVRLGGTAAPSTPRRSITKLRQKVADSVARLLGEASRFGVDRGQEGVSIRAVDDQLLEGADPRAVSVAFQGTQEVGPNTVVVTTDSGATFQAVVTLVERRFGVVAVAPIGRGELVVASAVAIKPVAEGRASGYTSIAEVVGKEATRGLRSGDPLDENNTAPPLAVRRGDEVTVVTGAAGVSVRMRGIAKQDGRIGELIGVETPGSGERLDARVVGPRRLAILSGSFNAPFGATIAGQPTGLLSEQPFNQGGLR